MAKPIWDDYVEQRFAEIQKEKQAKQDAKDKASAPPAKADPKEGPWTEFSKMAQQGEAVPNYSGEALPDPNSPVSDSSTQNALAGVGKAFNDVGTGVKQLAVDAVSLLPGKIGADATKRGQELRQETDEERRLSAPLMNTKAGMAGNIAGGVISALPAAAIPGAGTAIGAAAIGGALGATQPLGTQDSRLQNAGLGAATAGVSQLGLNKLGGTLAGRAAAGDVEAAAKNTQSAITNGAANDAKAAGYVIPPVQTNPSMINKAINAVVNPKELERAASIKNQANTNSLIKKGLGLAEDQPITPEALQNLRQNAGQAYEDLKAYPQPFTATPEYKQAIDKLGEEWSAAAKEFPGLAKNKQITVLQSALDKDSITPTGAVNIIKKLRSDATANLKSFDNPDKLALGFAQKKAASAVEDLIESNLKQSGSTELLDSYKNARQLIAKTHDIEGALNETTGDVSAKALAKLLDKGKPLTGELKQVASFAKAFGNSAQDASKLGAGHGIGIEDIATGSVGHALAGPLGALGLAARPITRNILLSNAVQKGSSAPVYTSNALTHGAGKLTNNDVVQRLTPALLSQAVTKQ